MERKIYALPKNQNKIRNPRKAQLWLHPSATGLPHYIPGPQTLQMEPGNTKQEGE